MDYTEMFLQEQKPEEVNNLVDTKCVTSNPVVTTTCTTVLYPHLLTKSKPTTFWTWLYKQITKWK